MNPNPQPDRAPLTSAQTDALIAAAREVQENAHSPYSKVRVGAALLASDGRTFAGCNVENASYGLTICAERNAIAGAIAAGAREFVAIAITTNLDRLLPPCGACRQVLHEFAPELEIHCAGTGGSHRSFSLRDCLPEPFGPSDLD